MQNFFIVPDDSLINIGSIKNVSLYLMIDWSVAETDMELISPLRLLPHFVIYISCTILLSVNVKIGEITSIWLIWMLC